MHGSYTMPDIHIARLGKKAIRTTTARIEEGARVAKAHKGKNEKVSPCSKFSLQSSKNDNVMRGLVLFSFGLHTYSILAR